MYGFKVDMIYKNVCSKESVPSLQKNDDTRKIKILQWIYQAVQTLCQKIECYIKICYRKNLNFIEAYSLIREKT